MKKLIFIFVVLVIILQSNIYAQNYSFGAKVSTIFSWSEVLSDDNFEYSNDGIKSGMGFGPSLKYKIGESFSTDISLLFTWQGTNFTQIGQAGEDFAYSTKLKYITLPVNFEGKIPVGDKTKAIINFGFIPAVKLSSTMDVTDKITSSNSTENKDFKGGIGNLFLSAGGGISYELSEGIHFSSVLLYNNGIFDIWVDEEDNQYVKELTLKNHFISLNFGLHIDF